MLRVGIKFCGGCNPNYERGDLLKRAKRAYPDDVFVIWSEADVFDLVIVICGCMHECFTFNCDNSRRGVLFVRSEEEYDRITEFMNKEKREVEL